MGTQYINGKCYDFDKFTVSKTDILLKNQYFTVRKIDNNGTVSINEKHTIKINLIDHIHEYNINKPITDFIILCNDQINIINGYYVRCLAIKDDKLVIKKSAYRFSDLLPYVELEHVYLTHTKTYFMVVDDGKYRALLFDSMQDGSDLMPVKTIELPFQYSMGCCPYPPVYIDTVDNILWFPPVVVYDAQVTIDDHTYSFKDTVKHKGSVGSTIYGLTGAHIKGNAYIIFNLYYQLLTPIIDLRNKCWILIYFNNVATTQIADFRLVLPYGNDGFITISSNGVKKIEAPEYYNITDSTFMDNHIFPEYKSTLKYTIIKPINSGLFTKSVGEGAIID